jgi:hypothetical protein
LGEAQGPGVDASSPDRMGSGPIALVFQEATARVGFLILAQPTL